MVEFELGRDVLEESVRRRAKEARVGRTGSMKAFGELVQERSNCFGFFCKKALGVIAKRRSYFEPSFDESVAPALPRRNLLPRYGGTQHMATATTTLFHPARLRENRRTKGVWMKVRVLLWKAQCPGLYHFLQCFRQALVVKSPK